MTESFVDLTYRGLPLGRRVKLTEIRPSTGYLEMPMPMPVGTAIQIATDEGFAFEATVVELHEQVGGSDKPPGMRVKPAFDANDGPYRSTNERAGAWWKERVALPELQPRRKAATAPPPVPILPRARRTAEMPGVPANELADDGQRTEAMDSVDPSMIEQLAADVIVDDGKRTIVMQAPDIAALGLEVSSSREMLAVKDDDDADDDKPDNNGGDDKGKSVRRRRKRR
jgi:hypothetical protein